MPVTMMLKDVLTITDDIGLNNYPIFNEDYRQPLNDKIINHFFMREIGYETIELFRFGIARKMNEIMPYYNKMYSTEEDFDPFITVDIATNSSSVGEGKSESENETTSVTDSKSRAVSSEMPQEMMRGDGNYASSGADSTSKSDVVGEGKDTSLSESKVENQSSTKGFQGDRVDILVRYRDSILNIDMLIIQELYTEFLSVISSSAGYSNKQWSWFL